ncbi:CpsD/CapB family tyrosine-protein kinase [Pseudooceanicola onchidii]|uniref:CpsD/CapB family tyrosine-protein kinase n=1 Tax=Pseudooceanicola onchidii TaxID=2562279 RepID=UPI0010AAFFBE|nr:CpsD/CapB family tyrosine-protein kinase [Pseudooceanicola onchidii]
MERLQTALDKARKKRAGEITEDPQVLRETSAPSLPVGVSEAWSNLAEIRLDRSLLQHNRLVAMDSSGESSAYDLLRTKLLRLSRQHGWKRIAIVSSAMSAGKSTTITNLAFSFARQTDVRAMAFDFDLRRPSMARLLGQRLSSNMGQVIRGEVPFEHHVMRHGMNMAFALNDTASRHSSELLQNHETADLLTAVEETYATDLILFDMPPLMAADDAHGFLRSVDAALIVMEAEKTPISQLDVIERQVAELTNVAGVVLNKCNYTDELYGTSYGYY